MIQQSNKMQLVKGNGSLPQKAKVYGGGSGGGDDMTGRVIRLEESVKEIKATLGRLEPLIVRIDEKLKHIPTTWQLFIAVIALILAALAVPPFYAAQIKKTMEPNASITSQQSVINNEPQASPSKNSLQ